MTILASAPSVQAKPAIPVRRQVAIAVFLILTLSGPAAMWFSPHFPTPLATKIALAVAGMSGLRVAWRARDVALSSAAKSRLENMTGRGAYIAHHPWLRVPLLGLAAFFLVFVDVRDGAFALVTAAVGEPAARTVTITGTYHPRKSCARFEVQEEGFLLDRALCATRQELAQAVRGRRLTLVGRASPLGLNVERFEFGPRP